jgi:hypothetical protein
MVAGRAFAAAIIAGPILVAAGAVWGHPGGLNQEGCHNDRKNGGYHCHRTPSGGSSAIRRQGAMGSGGGAFANCSAARAAGAAPVSVGDPGYGRHLDRDGDGVGCE